MLFELQSAIYFRYCVAYKDSYVQTQTCVKFCQCYRTYSGWAQSILNHETVSWNLRSCDRASWHVTCIVTCDRASWHVTAHHNKFLCNKQTRCTNFTNLFCHETLHVSDSSSVHHQEFIHCTLYTVYVIQFCRQLSSRARIGTCYSV